MEQTFEIPFELCGRQDVCSLVSRRGFLMIAASAVASTAYAEDSSSLLTASVAEAAPLLIDWPLS